MSWQEVLFLFLAVHPICGTQQQQQQQQIIKPASHEAAIDLCVNMLRQDHAVEPMDNVCNVLLAMHNITVERVMRIITIEKNSSTLSNTTS